MPKLTNRTTRTEADGEPADADKIGDEDNATDARTVKVGKAERKRLFGMSKRERWSGKRLLWTIGGVLAVVVLLIGGFLTWQLINSDSKAVTQVAGAQIAPDPKNPALATFNDTETGFRMSFPAAWGTQRTGSADVRLVAGPGGGNLMSVRVVTLDTGSAGPPTPISLKPYLDTIVNEPGVTMLQQTQVTISNIPGWNYVYTFKDTTTNTQGVHTQFFLIRGNRLYSIVFQALPQSDFSTLAPVYQQVIGSLQFF